MESVPRIRRTVGKVAPSGQAKPGLGFSCHVTPLPVGDSFPTFSSLLSFVPVALRSTCGAFKLVLNNKYLARSNGVQSIACARNPLEMLVKRVRRAEAGQRAPPIRPACRAGEMALGCPYSARAATSAASASQARRADQTACATSAGMPWTAAMSFSLAARRRLSEPK